MQQLDVLFDRQNQFAEIALCIEKSMAPFPSHVCLGTRIDWIGVGAGYLSLRASFTPKKPNVPAKIRFIHAITFGFEMMRLRAADAKAP